MIELVARRTQWVSSTETPMDKSLIGALFENKILIGGLSRIDAGVDVVAEQSPLKPSHFKLQSTQAFGVPAHALFLKQRPLRFPYGPFLDLGSTNSTLQNDLSFGEQL